MRRFFESTYKPSRPWRRSKITAACALALLALAACGPASASRENGGVQVLARALTTDAAEPPSQAVVERKLVTSGASAWARFGSTLAVSGDVLVSGAPDISALFAGAVYVFHRDATTNQWVERQQLRPHDLTQVVGFGDVLAVDGETVAVSISPGMLHGMPTTGGVYVFGRHEGGTDQWGAIIKISDAVLASEGFSLSSLAVAGDLLIVGATMTPDAGKVMIFERHRGGANTWGQVTTILNSDIGGPAGSDEAFGHAVALDGDTLLIGAPPGRNNFFGENDGSAYLFSRDSVDRDRWVYVTRLTAADSGSAYDGFGSQVALKGDTAVISAPSAGGTGGLSGPGAVYVFRRDASATGQWRQVAKLTAIDAAPFDAFGHALALTGDTLLIGANGKTVNFTSRQGAAYVFQRDSAASDTWKEIQKLTASDGLANDEFGRAVALHGQTSLIGAPYREGDSSPPGVHDFGGVYLYEISEQPMPCEQCFPPNAELVNGRVVEGSGGVMLGAADGALLAVLPVWIQEVPAPEEALSPRATPLSSFYSIGASITTTAQPTTAFVLALPVREGADTAHLAVAVRIPPERTPDDPGAAWVPLLGTYDAERHLFNVTLSTLFDDGSVFVLMQHPDVHLLEAARSLGGPTEVATANRTDPVAVTFDLYCLDTGAWCNADIIQLFKDQLAVAYNKFTQWGFINPWLNKSVGQIKSIGNDPNKQVVLTDLAVYYGNYISEFNFERPGSGRYWATEKLMSFYCWLILDSRVLHTLYKT